MSIKSKPVIGAKLKPRLKLMDTGYWAIVWSEWNGKRYVVRPESTGCKELPQAEAYFAAWKHEDKVTVAIRATPTVSDIIAPYRDKIKMRNPDGYKTTFYYLDLMERHFGAMRVGEITPKTFQDYRISRGVAFATSSRELTALRAAFKYVAKTSALRKRLNLSLDDIPDFDIPKSPEARNNYLKRREETEFYALALKHSEGRKRLSRLTLFVCIALDTAARTEAIQTLTWSRVDLDAGTIDFREPGKNITKKRRGVVPISRRLKPILERAYKERTTEYVLKIDGDVRWTYDAWVAKTPYPNTSKHDLRRTWATLAVQAGVSIQEVADVMCDTVEVILRHYAVHIPRNLRSAVNFRDRAHDEDLQQAAE